MKRLLILSALLLCGWARAQSATITLAWNWPTNQQPAEAIEAWWSPVLSVPVTTNAPWSFLMSQNCYTLVPPLPPTNAVFILWVANGPNWLYVTTDPVAGGTYTNAVNITTNIMTVMLSPTNNALFSVRLRGKAGPPGNFSVPAQWATAAASTGWVWVR